MIHRFAEIGSTNDECLRLAAAGAPGGTAVVADRQTAGRGRHGRAWSSPPGTGLYVSLLVRLGGPPGGRSLPGKSEVRSPKSEVLSPTLLPLVAGVAAARAVAAILRAAGDDGAEVRLKWPNDVLLNGRKLAGILVEGSFDPDGGFAAAVGLGVNVSTLPQDLPPRTLYPATSILDETGVLADREALLQTWLSEMDAALALWQSPDGAARLVSAWNALDANAGRSVRIALAADEDGSESVDGVDIGISSCGALRLRLASGEVRDILAGDCLGAGMSPFSSLRPPSAP